MPAILWRLWLCIRIPDRSRLCGCARVENRRRRSRGHEANHRPGSFLKEMKFLTDYGISVGSVFERRIAARALAALAIFSAGLSPCNPSNAASPPEVGFHFTVAQSVAGHVNYLRGCATCHGES